LDQSAQPGVQVVISAKTTDIESGPQKRELPLSEGVWSAGAASRARHWLGDACQEYPKLEGQVRGRSEKYDVIGSCVPTSTAESTKASGTAAKRHKRMLVRRMAPSFASVYRVMPRYMSA
jgi:hypothetical protein